MSRKDQPDDAYLTKMAQIDKSIDALFTTQIRRIVLHNQSAETWKKIGHYPAWQLRRWHRGQSLGPALNEKMDNVQVEKRGRTLGGIQVK